MQRHECERVTHGAYGARREDAARHDSAVREVKAGPPVALGQREGVTGGRAPGVQLGHLALHCGHHVFVFVFNLHAACWCSCALLYQSP